MVRPSSARLSSCTARRMSQTDGSTYQELKSVRQTWVSDGPLREDEQTADEKTPREEQNHDLNLHVPGDTSLSGLLFILKNVITGTFQ